MEIKHIASSLLMAMATGAAGCDGTSYALGPCSTEDRPAEAGDPSWYEPILVTETGSEPRCPEIRDEYVRWLQPKYANSVVGRARLEELQEPCFNEIGFDSCRPSEPAIATLRWEWLREGAPPVEDVMEVFVIDDDNPQSGLHYFEVWPSTIRLPQGRTCGGVSLDALPIAIRLQQAEPFYNAPAWGVTSDADIEAIINAGASERIAPDFTYDQVCSGEGPGTSPPEFWARPLDAVIP